MIDKLQLLAMDPLVYLVAVLVAVAWMAHRSRRRVTAVGTAGFGAGLLAYLVAGVWGMPSSQVQQGLRNPTGPEAMRLLEQMATSRSEMAERLTEVRHRRNRLLSGAVDAFGTTAGIGAVDMRVSELTVSLRKLVEEFERDYGADRLPDAENLSFRLVQATVAIAEERFEAVLLVVTEFDAVVGMDDGADRIALQVAANQIRGDALYGMRRWDLAFTTYERALELDSERIGTRVDSAKCLARLGRLAEALQRYDVLVNACRARVEAGGEQELGDFLAFLLADRGVVRLLQGDAASAIEDLDDAVGVLTRMLERERRGDLESDMAYILDNRGSALEALDQHDRAFEDYQESVKLLTRLVEEDGRTELSGDLGRSLSKRGLTLALRRKYDDAIRDYTKAIELCSALREKGAVAETMAALAASYSNRGLVYRGKRMNREAIKDYTRAVEIYGGLSESEGREGFAAGLAKSLGGRGVVFRKEELFDQSVADYTKAVNIFGNLIETMGRSELAADLAWNLNKRGEVLHIQGESEKAIEDFSAAVAIRSKLVEQSARAELADPLAISVFNRGFVYYSVMRFDEAIADFDRAIAIYQQLAATPKGRRYQFKLKKIIKNREAAIEARVRLLSANP